MIYLISSIMVLSGPSLDLIPGSALRKIQIIGADPDLNAANTQPLRELQGSTSNRNNFLSGLSKQSKSVADCTSNSENWVLSGSNQNNCMQIVPNRAVPYVALTSWESHQVMPWLLLKLTLMSHSPPSH